VAPSISLLTQADKETIHDRSLDLLQQVGIKFNSERALDLLAEAGCEIDRTELSAKIPAHLVEHALKLMPSQFLLAAPDPARDLVCGGGDLYYTAGGQAPFIRDLHTGQRHDTTSDDFIQCAHLIDALPEVGQWDFMVVPGDVPPVLGDLRCLELSLLHTSKPTLGWINDPKALPFALEMLDAVTGGRDAFRERPLFMTYISPISPLSNDGTCVDVTLDWAPYKPPLIMLFIPLAGLTAPVTLEGTILQENTAFLGNTVLYQLAAPGWPMLWGAAAATVDMRSLRISQGPEKNLMSMALIEMAKFYGVPCCGLGVTSDAKAIGFQSGLEGMFSGTLLRLAGVDNIWGGLLDSATLADLPYMVLATEGMRQGGRFGRGLTLDDEHLMADLIAEIGFSGKYIEHLSTATRFRQEHLMQEMFAREPFEQWQARGETETDMALAKTKAILEAHEPRPQDPDLVKELDRIMGAARRALVGKRTKRT